MRRQNDASTGKDKLRNANGGFVGRFTTGDFAVGLVVHAVAAVHGHVFFGMSVFVMMAGDRAMAGHATAH
ncbi:MAG TPA: hypothetical protein VKD70_05465 [Candidatus Acidoferrum sp.]|nr:hypothetical protein [Candidatus Acidoferrum sp.]